MPEFLLRDRITVVTVDEVDADLMELRWHITETGNGKPTYIHRTFHKGNGKYGSELLHRVILSRMEGRALRRTEYTDHRDRNPLNNSRANLRLATPSQNIANTKRHKDNTTGFKGVFRHRSGKFFARCAGKHLGTFPTAEEAHAAYCAAALERYGEFANFGTPSRLAAQHVHSATPDVGVPNGMAKGA